MSKYDRLSEHLRGLPGNSWTVSFAELERLLGFRLPFSAGHHQAWWGNNGASPQARSWLDVGWKVGTLRQLAETVVFEHARAQPFTGPKRIVDNGQALPPAPLQTKQVKLSLPAYAWDSADKIDCRISFQWQPVGRVVLDEKELPCFPSAPAEPGLYRFQIRGANGHATYIGETENLARRFQGYRTPSVGQLTNIRVRDKLLEALRNGEEVSVAIVVSGAEMMIGDIVRPVDWMSKPMRLILENVALVGGSSDLIESLNR